MAKNMLATLNLVTRNFGATILLARIRYWQVETKYGVVFDGHKWVRNSFTEWADEAGMTTTQVKYGLEALRKLNLIVTTKKMHQGKLCFYARVTSRVQTILDGTEGQICPDGVGKTALMVGANLPLPILTGDTTGETTGDTGEQEFASMKKQDPAGAGKGKKMQKFKSVHEVMTNTKANILLHKPDSAKGLGSVWTKFMAEKTGTFQGMPTIKALGQLKVFSTKCPPGKAEQVLLHTLPNWIAFTKRVEQDAGVKITPLLPSVDFLLKHASIAVMFAAPSKSSSPKHEATASIPIAEPVQLISLSKDEQVPTHEELLALINEPKEA